MNRSNPQGDAFEPQPEALDEAPPPEPPRRPIAVELGSAVLIVSGLFGLLQKVVNPLLEPTGGIDPVLFIAVGLDVLSLAAGILFRRGRSWVFAANVSALFAFLYLTLVSLMGIVFGALYLLVVVAAFVSREWFAGLRDWRATIEEARLRR